MSGSGRALLSRRSALAGSAALAVAGGLSACTAGSTALPPGPTGSRRPSVDEVTRRAAGAAETSLAELAAAITGTYSGPPAAGQRDAGTLVALTAAAQAAHVAHATALLRDLPASAAATATATPTGTTTPAPSTSPTATAPAVPGTVRAAAAALVRAQGAATAAHLAALPAVTGPLAALLASVAASDVAFASSLRPLTGGRR